MGQLRAQAPQDLVGKVAPEFVRNDLAGEKIDLKSYRGHVVLLDFWATWCGPCRKELPKFAQWQRKYRVAGLQILAVSMDDSAAPVRKAMRRKQAGFPVMMGDANLGEAYGGVLGLPITFLIDRDGNVAECIKGEAELRQLESKLRNLLAK